MACFSHVRDLVRSYRLRDLLLLPNLLSAARLPLAFAFPFVADRPKLALGVLGIAASTDVLDGFAARRLHQATPIGALVDGIADKVLGCCVMAALVRRGYVSPGAALLLATRELLELPLAIRLLVSPAARALDVDRAANRAGKLATTLELFAVIAVLRRSRLAPVMIGAAALAGLVAGVTYWTRELEAEREARRLDVRLPKG